MLTVRLPPTTTATLLDETVAVTALSVPDGTAEQPARAARTKKPDQSIRTDGEYMVCLRVNPSSPNAAMHGRARSRTRLGWDRQISQKMSPL
jgi:hypothetical protein